MSFLISSNNVSHQLISDPHVYGMIGGNRDEATQLEGFEAFKNYFIKLINLIPGVHLFDKEEFLHSIYNRIYPQPESTSTAQNRISAIINLFDMMKPSDREQFSFEFFQDPVQLLIEHKKNKLMILSFQKTDENIAALYCAHDYFTKQSEIHPTQRRLKQDINLAEKLMTYQQRVNSYQEIITTLAKIHYKVCELEQSVRTPNTGYFSEINNQIDMLNAYLKHHQYLQQILSEHESNIENGENRDELLKLELIRKELHNTPYEPKTLIIIQQRNAAKLQQISEHWLSTIKNSEYSLDSNAIAHTKENILALKLGWQAPTINNIYSARPSLINNNSYTLISFFEKTFQLLDEMDQYQNTRRPSEENLSNIKNKLAALTSNSKDPMENQTQIALKKAIDDYTQHFISLHEPIAQEERILFEKKSMEIEKSFNMLEQLLDHFDISSEEHNKKITTQLEKISSLVNHIPEYLRADFKYKHLGLSELHDKYIGLQHKSATLFTEISTLIYHKYDEKKAHHLLDIINQCLSLPQEKNADFLKRCMDTEKTLNQIVIIESLLVKEQRDVEKIAQKTTINEQEPNTIQTHLLQNTILLVNKINRLQPELLRYRYQEKLKLILKPLTENPQAKKLINNETISTLKKIITFQDNINQSNQGKSETLISKSSSLIKTLMHPSNRNLKKSTISN